MRARLTLGVDGAKNEIKVEKRRGHERSAEDFIEIVIEITVVGIVVNVIGRRSALAYSGMPICNLDIPAFIGLLVVNIKARRGTASRRTRRGTAIRCLALYRQVETATRRQRDRSRDNRGTVPGDSVLGRKVDSQLQSRIRCHVPKDSFLIYNCFPRKLKRHSSQNQMPTFAIFSTL